MRTWMPVRALFGNTIPFQVLTGICAAAPAFCSCDFAKFRQFLSPPTSPHSRSPSCSPANTPPSGMTRHSSSTQRPFSRIASYMASGARSAPVGQCTAPNTTSTCRNLSGSRRGSKDVPSSFGTARKRSNSTSPCVPATNATLSREPGNACADTTRHGTWCRIVGTTVAVRSLLEVSFRRTASSPRPSASTSGSAAPAAWNKRGD